MNEDYGIDQYWEDQYEMMEDASYEDFIAEQQAEEYYDDWYEDAA